MKKRDSKREKRIKKMIVCCGLCAVILILSTYAWFIGMKTVNLSSFDVKVSAIDSLYLSLDGKEWKDELIIDETTIDPKTTYANHTNTPLATELVPMSSVGKIDKTSSRLVLFEKGSLTATPGGYRIMASKVNNTGAKEERGYIAFDLFVKNMSGKEYYKEYNPLNEEAIYLTPNSKVTASANGGDDKAGIENSVRIGFSQIGRVKADVEDETKIQGINCAGTEADGVTTICEKRDAQIWEPNDTKHVQNAINWYNTSCKKRTAADLTKDDSYSATDSCGTIADGTTYPTYAISSVIDETNQVDVYDGAEYNGYTSSITTEVGTEGSTGKLFKFPYFTDTQKIIQGVNRPEFISLAPNSITKVRVYIWLEGQDIDNYDFASLGKKISVAFGFTKEKLYGSDIDYDGNPELDEDVATHPNYTPAP